MLRNPRCYPYPEKKLPHSRGLPTGELPARKHREQPIPLTPSFQSRPIGFGVAKVRIYAWHGFCSANDSGARGDVQSGWNGFCGCFLACGIFVRHMPLFVPPSIFVFWSLWASAMRLSSTWYQIGLFTRSSKWIVHNASAVNFVCMCQMAQRWITCRVP
jgi:hypothetical protein